jgi:hypothetical protein
MKAELIQREKVQIGEQSSVEMVVWKVPAPVSPSTHAYKYRLVYIVDDVRVVDFDHELSANPCHSWRGQRNKLYWR